MAISNYGELQTAVAEWFAKSNLSARAADFITLAGTRIYYGSEDELFPSEPVRTFEMQATEAPSASGTTISLPTRYLSTIRLRAANGTEYWSLDYIPPAAFADFESNSGYPSVYTFINGAIEVGGTATVTFRHDYYQSFAAFSASTDTNALLTKAPGLWLYGACLEAALYQKNDADAQRFFRLYRGVSGALNWQKKEAGSGTLQMRVR